jgi:hypothetical protein
VALAGFAISIPAFPVLADSELVEEALLPEACVGEPYNASVAGPGAQPDGTFFLDPGYLGDLPPGLTLNEDGSFTGTPTTAGSFEFPVEYEDSSGGAGDSFTIVVTEAPCSEPGGGSNLVFDINWDHYLKGAENMPGQLPDTL